MGPNYPINLEAIIAVNSEKWTDTKSHNIPFGLLEQCQILKSRMAENGQCFVNLPIYGMQLNYISDFFCI